MGAERSKDQRAANVRRFRAEDADGIMKIVGESPSAASWSRESYARFANNERALLLVSETAGAITGFFVGRRVEDQAEVLNLAVDAKHRRRGEGTGLLAAAHFEFAEQGAKSVYLEVRESNTGAIAFYQKHGFAKTGLRKGYYRNPDEAAVTMEKKLTG